MGGSDTHLALNLSPAATISLPLPPLMKHKGTEEPGLVLVQGLLAAECLPAFLTLSWTHFSISEDTSARSAPKKVPLREELEQRKFPSLVLSSPAFQLFGSGPVPCLHPSKLKTMSIIIHSCFGIVSLCTFQSILMHIILFDTETREKRQGRGREDNTYHFLYPIHPLKTIYFQRG